MKYKYFLFDLDGTISESAIGIRESLEKAILKLNKPIPDLDDYTLYIGPPLIDTFKNLCGFTDEVAHIGVEYYREYYNTKGKYRNKLYAGIDEVLRKLKKSGAQIAVCSSKYEKFAEEIIDYLGVKHYFDAVCGSTLDGSRKDKKDLIPYAVNALGGTLEENRSEVVMIGDTHFDAKGARVCGVDFVGAEYGYGAKQAMLDEGAVTFASDTTELYDILSK